MTATVSVAIAMSPTCVRVGPRTSVRVGPCAVVNVVIVMYIVVIVMHSGLGYMAVSIEAVALMVVATLVSHEYCRTSMVEAVSVIVRVDSERPATGLPCYGTIEVGAAHVLVILPGVQHEAEVCITTIPPDAEYVVMTVYTQQVVEIDLIDCLILRCREVQLVSHLVRKEQSLVLGCIIAHCVGRDSHDHHHCHKHHLLHNLISYSL